MGINCFGYCLKIIQVVFTTGTWFSCIANPFVYFGLFSIEVVIQSILTQKFSHEINQVNSAFRVVFGLAGLIIGLIATIFPLITNLVISYALVILGSLAAMM